MFISHKVFFKSVCESQFPNKSVNLFCISVIVKDKLTDLWGGCLLQNDFKSTLCEVIVGRYRGFLTKQVSEERLRWIARFFGVIRFCITVKTQVTTLDSFDAQMGTAVGASDFV